MAKDKERNARGVNEFRRSRGCARRSAAPPIGRLVLVVDGDLRPVLHAGAPVFLESESVFPARPGAGWLRVSRQRLARKYPRSDLDVLVDGRIGRRLAGSACLLPALCV